MLFDSWPGLFRVLVVGALANAALVLLLRASGKCAPAKLNDFALMVPRPRWQAMRAAAQSPAGERR